MSNSLITSKPPLRDSSLEVVETVVEPCSPFRLGGGSPDGLLRRRGKALIRLIEVDSEYVVCSVVQATPTQAVFRARATSAEIANQAIQRMRFALAIDDDLQEFCTAFSRDPLIGRIVRRNPYLRPARRPDPWLALQAAITEQLIEYDKAIVIQRRMITTLGHHCHRTDLRAAPNAHLISTIAPARLESFGLSANRSLALRKSAQAVSSGWIDLESTDHELTWKKLRTIPGIGPWTLEMLAVYGQGRYDYIPAGDLSYIKIVGQLLTGNPYARATIEEVREFFAPYGKWRALAGDYLRWAAARGLLEFSPLSSALV